MGYPNFSGKAPAAGWYEFAFPDVSCFRRDTRASRLAAQVFCLSLWFQWLFGGSAYALAASFFACSSACSMEPTYMNASSGK